MEEQKENNKTKTAGEKNFAELLNDEIIKIPQQGDIISGEVLSASKAEVRLDINGIMTGVVRGQELYHEAEEYANLKPGDKIEATVIEEDNENGELELSFRHAGQQKAWGNLIDSFKNKTDIKVKVDDANKGGLVISYAQIVGFLPVSQLAPENYPRISGGDRGKILEKLKSFIGKDMKVRVINIEEQEGKVVVSERKAWQEKQKDVISKYKVGGLVEGRIAAMTSFGVFVSFDKNLEGLIHISELAWQRIDNPADLFKVGDQIKAEIISIDGSKIFLSAKRLIKDPWKNVAKKYKEGQTVDGEILKVNPFGLFVKLDADIHGLSHISQLNLAPGQKIHDVFKQGGKQKFIIASIDAENHRLGLVIPDGKTKKHENTETRKHENTENTKTRKHKNTENTKTQKHENTKTQKQEGKKEEKEEEKDKDKDKKIKKKDGKEKKEDKKNKNSDKDKKEVSEKSAVKKSEKTETDNK
ncbi:S1 RNA-binding domain-containing protein [Patescibacteria group bacterium]|nr:S1 RNA-binding domain-containing protein [Candidatus Falkowbacteria bacterium]MBU3905578.1 S1 RNA-binding domain-containing protein [Patescibacteria group bacterium]MBU4026263.1 S1 RNA-binding domain-containing protein [Patescibacteria group bacterium]MBU4073619.1 S1 RNA-binding domain-containing protein [Patescibacteria group bacterium]MBU4102262.1 S1 RNA-binding domain-containing protein [Patescibacteria group bacterium]